MPKKYIIMYCSFLFLIIFVYGHPYHVEAEDFSTYKAIPPLHIAASALAIPQGLSPNDIKQIYNLPQSGGSGTIALIGAYNDPKIAADLAVFSKMFNLPPCTTANKCFEKHLMFSHIATNDGWALETSMDAEWAHAIAPNAHILLIEAGSENAENMLKAIDYARNRKDVVAISMSWGGPEFKTETTLENHFISPYGATFFASSGDNGAGVSWPAVSINVVAVGGTHLTLSFSPHNGFISEQAWSGSGGGVSAYIKQPLFQSTYSISRSLGMRAIPDVSFNADPASGYSVYDSFGYFSKKGWFTLGGTSAGAPQWAAIKALGKSASNPLFYSDKASTNNSGFFRDIVSGVNGNCGYFCTARAHYDYVTGLGSPLTTKF